jgi:hypothetical protein
MTINERYVGANHTLKANLSTLSLAQIAHEFWHAYKAQIAHGGSDPDTAQALSALKAWLGQQTKVTYMKNESPAGTMTFAKANPGYFKNAYFATQAKFTDGFADAYLAAIITDLMSFWPYPNAHHSTTSTDNYLANILNDFHVGYFNDHGKNYRIDAAPRPM